MSKIGPSELDERLSRDDVFVLDVRPSDDYRERHIDGSYNAPVYDDLRQGETEALDAHLDRVPEDERVVTVCKAGVVAREATNHLQERDYEAATLSGGFTGWRHYEDDTLLYRVLSLVRTVTG
ncbi:rhodanese-like domain-containing protein [Halomicrococcus sp. NG-SE-24]|uniref:rhodanese-like domain-containing protein n=1 Tax=Halomicrococcus sp. NG-SE-24 TaxID=3436928 RepID=UPI003D998C4D